jgi:hypothetical protein
MFKHLRQRVGGRRRCGWSIGAMLTLLLAAALLAGCGSSSSAPPEKGLLVAGPGVRATSPPWPPQYRALRPRLARLGIPTSDSEKFHIHALLSIYNQGLLVPVPPNVGIDKPHRVESSLHTHDYTGIIHMEAAKPFRATLGGFFAEWGVRFGAGTLGALEDHGQNRVWVYVNGRLISDPARYVLHNGDDIAVGYGPQGSFPHRPPTRLLEEVERGGSALACSTSTPTKKASSCLAPTAKRSTKAK